MGEGAFVIGLSHISSFSHKIAIQIHKKAIFRIASGIYVTGTVLSEKTCQNFLMLIVVENTGSISIIK